jgi:hypothetical protein
MIENYRTGLGWRLFMANPEIGSALKAIGFAPDAKKIALKDASSGAKGD